MTMRKLPTPEQYFESAARAVDVGKWDQATAEATTGLLSLMIGAMQGLAKASEEFKP